MTGSLSQTRGRPTINLRLTMEQYGEVFRAAFIEGFTQGALLPHGEAVTIKANEQAALYWQTVEDRVYGPRSLSPADDGGA